MVAQKNIHRKSHLTKSGAYNGSRLQLLGSQWKRNLVQNKNRTKMIFLCTYTYYVINVSFP